MTLFKYNDGGRSLAGYKKPNVGDCVVRAIAIVTELPYQTVYDAINLEGSKERLTKRRVKKGKSSAEGGVYNRTYRNYMAKLGWEFIPTMTIGSGCKVHLKSSELPSGRIVVRLSRHLCAVVDGVINDLSDCSRNETRCVYGYFAKQEVGAK